MPSELQPRGFGGLALAFVLGLAASGACVSPLSSDCDLGSLGCECALGLCDVGLECVDDLCVPTSAEETVGDGDPGDGDGDGDPGDGDGDGDGDPGDGDGDGDGDPGDEIVYDALIDTLPHVFDLEPFGVVSVNQNTARIIGNESAPNVGAMSVLFPADGPGVYQCVMGSYDVDLYFTGDLGEGSLEHSGNTTGNCTITVDEFGEVGGIISGTFEGSVQFFGQGNYLPHLIEDGRFRVVRIADM